MNCQKNVDCLLILFELMIFTFPSAEGNCNTTFADTPGLNCNDQKKNRTKIKLGYLTSYATFRMDTFTQVKGHGKKISGALLLALEKVNNCSCHFEFVVDKEARHDTQRDEKIALKATMDLMYKNNVSALIGLEGPNCHYSAQAATSMNRLMISYGCSDEDVSDHKKYSTFIRLLPTNSQLIRPVIALLEKYSWKKFTIVYQEDDEWESIARHLNRQKLHLKLKLPKDMFKNGKYKSRIFVFLGSRKCLRYFIRKMGYLGYFNDPTDRYLVIYVEKEMEQPNLDSYIRYSTDVKEDKNKLKWSNSTHIDCRDTNDTFNLLKQSLIVVAPSLWDVENVEKLKFDNDVRKWNKNISADYVEKLTLPCLQSKATIVPIHASYLYDSVILYAKALANVTTHGDNLISVMTDGTLLAKTIINMGHFQSISGEEVYIDANGNSEGSFTAFAFTDEKYMQKIKSEKNENGTCIETTFSCHRFFKKLGKFTKEDETLELNITDFKTHDKLKEIKDEPHCGFDGEKCKEKEQIEKMLLYIALGVFLLLVVIVMVYMYHQRHEQKIEGMSWKIDPQNFKEFQQKCVDQNRNSISSTFTTGTPLLPTSYNIKTGIYKNWQVRVKEIYFSQKKGISREEMIELKNLREIHHKNINPFIGAHMISNNDLLILTEFCSRGSLQDILADKENVKLDHLWMTSFIIDLVKGMHFLHYSTPIEVHGNLRSSNCVITSRWLLKITDFGIQQSSTVDEILDEEAGGIVSKLLWKAPELLRDSTLKGTKKGDVYSFAIIWYELFRRPGVNEGPYVDSDLSQEQIIKNLRGSNTLDSIMTRPDLEALKRHSEVEPSESKLNLMRRCWNEDAALRPDFNQIRKDIKHYLANNGMSLSIMDHFQMSASDRLEQWNNHLEEMVHQKTQELNKEKQLTQNFLYRMLPPTVASKLIKGQSVEPETYSDVTIYFSDIVGFTSLSAQSTPYQIVTLLHRLYLLFDATIQCYDAYKVETIGDAYMVASGVPEKTHLHAANICTLALELLENLKNFKIKENSLTDEILKLRIGIHSGSVMAGVVGSEMPRYCLFGDTVNTASRHESTGEPHKIQISKECFDELEKFNGAFITKERGEVEMKGKGKRMCYWLLGQDMSRNPVKKSIPDNCRMPFWKRPKSFRDSSGNPESDTVSCATNSSSKGMIQSQILLRPKFVNPSRPNSQGYNTPGIQIQVQRQGTPTGLKKQWGKRSLRTKLFEKSKSSSNIRSEQFEEEDLSTHHSLIELDIIKNRNESNLMQERKRHLTAL